MYLVALSTYLSVNKWTAIAHRAGLNSLSKVSINFLTLLRSEYNLPFFLALFFQPKKSKKQPNVRAVIEFSSQ